jgi:hypothetical protein
MIFLRHNAWDPLLYSVLQVLGNQVRRPNRRNFNHRKYTYLQKSQFSKPSNGRCRLKAQVSYLVLDGGLSQHDVWIGEPENPNWRAALLKLFNSNDNGVPSGWANTRQIQDLEIWTVFLLNIEEDGVTVFTLWYASWKLAYRYGYECVWVLTAREDRIWWQLAMQLLARERWRRRGPIPSANSPIPLGDTAPLLLYTDWKQQQERC